MKGTILLSVLLVCIQVYHVWAKTKKPNTIDHSPIIQLNLDEQSGQYNVKLHDQVWLESSNDVFIHKDGKKMSLLDGSLKYLGSAKTKVEKESTQYDLYYGAPSSTGISPETVLLRGSIRVFERAVIFAQSFPNELRDSSIGNADSITTSFPAFQIKEEHGGDGFAQWISWYYENLSGKEQNSRNSTQRNLLVAPGFNSPQFGKWDDQSILLGGLGGSGIISVFDKKGQNSMVMSATPASAMTTSHVSSAAGKLNFGIMGNVSDVPKAYHIEVLVQFGEHGVPATVREWGAAMRAPHKKPPASSAREKDITLQYLGFTTDNGAYYYYHTEDNKNYEDTLLDVAQYAKKNSIPYRYVLLDSWWYHKGSNGGVSDWTAQTELFPHGLSYLHEKTKWFVQAHNRYWALDNVYAKENGGKYDFILDRVKNGSVPNDPTFWTDLLSEPSSKWGLKVYEQDWLFNEFAQYVTPMLSDVTIAQKWLSSMADGAKKNGLSIQYCMPYIRHVLASAQFDVVTQARASDDYVVSPYEGPPNWRIGGQSLVFDALGLASSKDGYWSSSKQPNNPYGEERYESCPRLQAAVTALSAGPVAIADGIGYTDVPLVMKSCSKSGKLLQPSAPITPISSWFVESALHNGLGPKGDVWFAPSVLPQQDKHVEYGTLFVANLMEDFEVTPQMIGLVKHDATFYAFEANNTALIQKFSNSHPLKLKACGASDFQLWSIAPMFDNKWTFLGEVDKWAVASPARFKNIITDNNGLRVTAFVTDDEVVNGAFVNPHGKIVNLKCSAKNGRKEILLTSVGACL